jgi:hypothetical protein
VTPYTQSLGCLTLLVECFQIHLNSAAISHVIAAISHVISIYYIFKEYINTSLLILIIHDWNKLSLNVLKSAKTEGSN